MDLIWAVRRIAFRHAVEHPAIKRPPRHPVYPDRYRPGDPSDNTQRPKKRGREMEKSDIRTGTAADPIELDEESMERNESGTAANSSAKRLKIIAGQIGRHKVELPRRPKVLNPVHPARFPNVASKGQGRGRQAARRIVYMPPAHSLNLPPPRPSSVGPVFDNPRPLVANPRDRTVQQLQRVNNILKENVEGVVECGMVMMSVYDNDDRLGGDIIYTELEMLKAKLDSCLTDGECGIQTVERIVSLIEDNKDRVIESIRRRV